MLEFVFNGLILLVQETMTKEAESYLVGTGELLDLHEITEKYKNRPERLKGILQNAKRCECPTSGVELIEDMVYKTTTKVGEKRQQFQTNNVVQEKKLKAAPKPKAKAKAKAKAIAIEASDVDAGADVARAVPPLTDAQTKVLEQFEVEKGICLDNLQELKEILDKAENQEWVKMMPAYVASKVTAELLSVGAEGDKWDVIKEAGGCDDFKGVTKDWKGVMSQAREAKRCFDVQSKEAQKILAKVSATKKKAAQSADMKRAAASVEGIMSVST